MNQSTNPVNKARKRPKTAREMARTLNAVEACHDQLREMLSTQYRGHGVALARSAGLPYTRLRRWLAREVKFLSPAELRALWNCLEALIAALPKPDPDTVARNKRRAALAQGPIVGGIVLE